MVTKIKKIQPEEDLVDFSSSEKDASDAETPMTDQQVAQPKIPNAIIEARWPLCKSVHAVTPSKGSPDREQSRVPGPRHPLRR